MLSKITDAVKKAGEIYKSAGSDLGIKEKGSGVNLVTKYDKKIEQNYSRMFVFRRGGRRQ